MPIAILSASYLHNKKIPLLSKRDYYHSKVLVFCLVTIGYKTNAKITL